LLNIEAVFVVSAATARDLPSDGLPEIALVGRSNVGKSSLINALVRQRVARTSGAPGKTRLANIYRVRRGLSPAFYLVDLPGYGYARGDARELAKVTREYFDAAERFAKASRSDDQVRSRGEQARSVMTGARGFSRAHAALLLIDSRHPGLRSDIDAWQWLTRTMDRAAIVATKIDKLSRSERQRAMTTNEAVFEHPVVPVSADTGEGLDELWKLIDRMTKSE
jgi:GTP-binding protein